MMMKKKRELRIQLEKNKTDILNKINIYIDHTFESFNRAESIFSSDFTITEIYNEDNQLCLGLNFSFELVDPKIHSIYENETQNRFDILQKEFIHTIKHHYRSGETGRYEDTIYWKYNIPKLNSNPTDVVLDEISVISKDEWEKNQTRPKYTIKNIKDSKFKHQIRYI